MGSGHSQKKQESRRIFASPSLRCSSNTSQLTVYRAHCQRAEPGLEMIATFPIPSPHTRRTFSRQSSPLLPRRYTGVEPGGHSSHKALNLGGTHRGPRHDPRTKLLESHASPKVIGVQKALALLWFSELLRSVAQRSSGSGDGLEGVVQPRGGCAIRGLGCGARGP